MLKTQLHSKIYQINSQWRDIEDILTGDYFGVMDYLPREPFLKSFIYQLLSLNPEIRFPNMDSVNWEQLCLQFWPMKTTGDTITEPDLIILCNQWIIVVEVKLFSGLGSQQLWREYQLGQSIANENNIPHENVFCLLLSRNRIKDAEVFRDLEPEQRNTLRSKIIYLRWHEATSIVESWSRYGVFNKQLKKEHQRIIADLLAVLRRRRNLLFSGFAFSHMENVNIFQNSIFAPELFEGFLDHMANVSLLDCILVSRRFNGFCIHSKKCQPSFGFWEELQFNGFQNTAKQCTHSSKYIIGDSNENN